MSELTDEKIQSIWMNVATFDTHLSDVISFARAIEDELNEQLTEAKQDAYAKGFNRGQGSMPWPIGSPGYLTSMAIDLGEE